MTVILVIVWILAGMVIMGLLVWFAMPLLMLSKHKSKFNYDQTVQILGETLEKIEDWHVLTVNDYQKKTAEFVTLERVCSLSVCNPRYSSQILVNDEDRGVTAIMPLEFGVYENKKGQVFVSQLNVGLLGKMFGGTIGKVMGIAGKDLQNVVKAVSE